MKNKTTVSDVFTQCFLRDGHTCQDCGSNENLEIHHILPVSQGGKNVLNNLKTVCEKCHVLNYKDVHYVKDKTKLIPIEEREKTRHGIDRTKKSQVIVSIPNELLDRIETFWHAAHIKNRTEAIRVLIERGLDEHEKEQSEF